MPEVHRTATRTVYQALVASPLRVLSAWPLEVNTLPAANDGTIHNLWFAYRNGAVVVDQNQAVAAAYVGGHIDCAYQRPMVVSPMRAHGLPVGAGAGQRHQATGQILAGAGHADLWVTERQSGCSVMMLDFGASRFGMIHLQPSADGQFNRLGRGLIQMSDTTRSGYKNEWLKKELTTIIANTGATPQRYMIVQSMFEASRGHSTQVVGIRVGSQFRFYRQITHGTTVNAELLNWSTWWAYLPYFTY